MFNKLYVDTQSSAEKDWEALEAANNKSGLRKIISYFFALIGGQRAGKPKVIAAINCVKAKALLTFTDGVHNADTITITPITLNNGKVKSDYVITFETGYEGITGISATAATYGIDGLTGSAGARAIQCGAFLAEAVNHASGGCYGIVGATDNGDGSVLFTCERYGALGNNLVIAENANHVGPINNTSGNFQFGSTGIYIGHEGTEYIWEF